MKKTLAVVAAAAVLCAILLLSGLAFLDGLRPNSAFAKIIPAGGSSGSSAAGFGVGQRVKTTSRLRVRVAPAIKGKTLGIQPKGASGTVAGGPVASGGYTWLKIKYDKTPSGWSAAAYLSALQLPAAASLSVRKFGVSAIGDALHPGSFQLHHLEQVFLEITAKDKDYVFQINGQGINYQIPQGTTVEVPIGSLGQGIYKIYCGPTCTGGTVTVTAGLKDKKHD